MLSVTWNEDGTGWEKCKNGGCRVYMFNAGIKYAIYDTLSWIVQDPESFAKDVDPNVRAIFTVVSRIRPRVDRQKVMQVLFAKCRKFLRSLKGDSDAEFLAQLNRNWKEGCAICLTDKIMGTTCGCGHTEIIVFRPCGHSCCKEPCFFEFNKAAPRKKRYLKVQIKLLSFAANLPSQLRVDLTVTCVVNQSSQCFGPRKFHFLVSFRIHLFKSVFQKFSHKNTQNNFFLIF